MRHILKRLVPVSERAQSTVSKTELDARGGAQRRGRLTRRCGSLTQKSKVALCRVFVRGLPLHTLMTVGVFFSRSSLAAGDMLPDRVEWTITSDSHFSCAAR